MALQTDQRDQEKERNPQPVEQMIERDLHPLLRYCPIDRRRVMLQVSAHCGDAAAKLAVERVDALGQVGLTDRTATVPSTGNDRTCGAPEFTVRGRQGFASQTESPDPLDPLHDGITRYQTRRMLDRRSLGIGWRFFPPRNFEASFGKHARVAEREQRKRIEAVRRSKDAHQTEGYHTDALSFDFSHNYYPSYGT